MIKFWVAFKTEKTALPLAQKFPTCKDAADFERDARFEGFEIVKLNSIAEYLIAERR